MMKPIICLIKGHLQLVEVYARNRGINLLAEYDEPWGHMMKLFIMTTSDMIPTYPDLPIVPESPK